MVSGVSYNPVSYSEWSRENGVNAASYTNVSSTSFKGDNAQNDSVTFSRVSDGCTDGKDDGKIGFFGALGNAIKGAGKTLVNGVKSCFTNKEGKFSLGKTLLTAGTAALCIAVPPVGVAACAVGATVGAVQVGKGVYNASKATTDAEAKDAWQNVGGGALTVGMSVAGGKAALSATKASSTANALNSLDDAATVGQKLSAFGKDAVSSTKNNLGKINVKNMATTAKTKATDLAASAKSKASSIKSSVVDKLDDGSVTTTIKNKATDLKNTAQTGIKNVQQKFNNSDTGIARSLLKEAKASGNADDILVGKQLLKDAIASDAKALANGAKTTIKDTTSSSIPGIKNLLAKGDSAVKNIASNLSSKGKQIVSDMTDKNATYTELVQNYGYENVKEVLTAFAGVQVSKESV